MANYSKNQQDESSQGLYCKPNRRRLKLKDVIRYRGVVEGLERSDREIEEELFDEDNVLESKMT